MSWRDLLLTDFALQCGGVRKKAPTLERKVQLALTWRYFGFDFFFAYFCSGLWVVAFWRSSWELPASLLNHIFGEENCVVTNVIATVAGLSVAFPLHLFQRDIRQKLAGEDFYSARYKAIMVAFSVVLAYVDIMFWKGLWEGVNCVFGLKMFTAWCTLAVGTLVLSFARCLRSIVSPPVGVVPDAQEVAIQTSSILDALNTDQHSLAYRCLDVVISYVLEVFVVLFWHGLWTLEDLYSNQCGIEYEMSAWISVIAGFLAAILVILLQFPLVAVLSNYSSNYYVLKLVFSLFFNLLAGFATINGFRGFWYVVDVYFMPDDYVGGRVQSQLLAILFLIVFNCVSSLNPGMFRDCNKTYDGHGGLIFYYYSTYYFIKDQILGCKDEEDHSVELRKGAFTSSS